MYDFNKSARVSAADGISATAKMGSEGRNLTFKKSEPTGTSHSKPDACTAPRPEADECVSYSLDVLSLAV
jgi:hypothetical protein